MAKFSDKETLSIAASVSDVLEGKVNEGSLKVTDWEVDGDGPSYKKFGLKFKKTGSGRYGGIDATITGPDAKLLAFAKASLGVDNKARNLKDAQKQIEEKMANEEVKYPHMMYGPNGEEVEVKDKAEHEKYAAKGYTHDKPKNESPEEPRPEGEKEFKRKHSVKKSGENEDGTVTKEEKKELTKEEKYKEFFQKALKKFGVDSPAELDKEKRKEFFDYVDKNWKGDNESD